MGGRKNPFVLKCRNITNEYNYDTGCTLTSLPISDIENLKSMIFVAQCVHCTLPKVRLHLCSGHRVNIRYRCRLGFSVVELVVRYCDWTTPHLFRICFRTVSWLTTFWCHAERRHKLHAQPVCCRLWFLIRPIPAEVKACVVLILTYEVSLMKFPQPLHIGVWLLKH
jgi:hypothetical protein